MRDSYAVVYRTDSAYYCEVQFQHETRVRVDGMPSRNHIDDVTGCCLKKWENEKYKQFSRVTKERLIRFEAFTAVTMKNVVFRDVESSCLGYGAVEPITVAAWSKARTVFARSNMSVCVYSVFVVFFVQVAALRLADPPCKESYRLCIGLRN
jgi:hypothetical protein